MSVRSVTACDNSRVITGSTMPSLLIHSDRGVYGVAMPPAMPPLVAAETVGLFAAAPDMLAALQGVAEQQSGADFADGTVALILTDTQWAAVMAAIAKAEGKL